MPRSAEISFCVLPSFIRVRIARTVSLSADIINPFQCDAIFRANHSIVGERVHHALQDVLYLHPFVSRESPRTYPNTAHRYPVPVPELEHEQRGFVPRLDRIIRCPPLQAGHSSASMMCAKRRTG